MLKHAKIFKSIKSLVLTGAGFAFAIILGIAIYGQALVLQTLENSEIIEQQNHQLRSLITAVKLPISSLEGLLFQHLLTLERADKKTTLLVLNQIEDRLDKLGKLQIIRADSQLNSTYLNITTNFQQLSKEIRRVSNFINNERFPALQTILDRIDPGSNQFYSEILILQNLAEELATNPGMESFLNDIQQLKYSWLQSVSSMRLMISSRTGIFGHPTEAIQFLDRNQQQYNRDIERRFSQISNYQTLLADDFVFTSALETIKQAIDDRLVSANTLMNILKSPNWRQDVFITQTVIQPLIIKLTAQTFDLESQLDLIDATNNEHSEVASQQLSQFLWIFVAMMLILLLMTYFIIEFLIRKPLLDISSAMSTEHGDPTGRLLEKVGALEIDLLVDSFTQMQKQIQLRQQRLNSILQNAGEGIIVVNQLAEIDTANFAAEKIFNVGVKDMVKKNFFSLVDPNLNEDIREKMLAGISATRDCNNDTQAFVITARGLLPNHQTFPFDLTISSMKLEDQVFRILVIRDASLRIKNDEVLHRARIKSEKTQQALAEQVERLKQTQTQLIESEKMASLAGLVAGIAHEINTPVGIGVTAASHLHQEVCDLANRQEAEQLTQDYLSEFIGDAKYASNIILNNLKRASELIRSFKQVAVDQSSEQYRHLNLKAYIDEVILNLNPKLKKTRHQLTIEVADDITMNSHAGALSQILTNLIFNSLLHAYDEGQWGIISIKAHQVDEQITIQYADDGKGMDAEIREKIFEPFFTTKRGSGGSGLGMHIVYNLVTTSLKGKIKCQSTLGEGTLFRLDLPKDIA